MSIQKKGEIYYVVISYRDELGRKKNKWVKSGKSIKEAEKLERKLKRDADCGEFIAQKKQSFSSYLDQWFDLYVKTSTKIGTQKKYEAHIKIIKNTLGKIDISKLSELNIQKFLAIENSSGKSGTYLYDIFATLKRSLDHAVKWRIIS